MIALRVLFSLLAFLTFALAAPKPLSTGNSHKTSVKGIGVNISNPDATDIIANRYIVVYNNDASDDDVQIQQANVMSIMKKRDPSLLKRDGTAFSARMHAVSMMGWRAMSLDAEDDMIIDIQSNPMVSYVEADTRVKASSLVKQSDAPAGLRRLSAAKSGAAAYVFDDSAGVGITAYIVDTGIRTTHEEFEGRAIFAANMVNNVDTDENGHGSHVAGTIGGATFGVCKSVKLKAVKVLDASGGGSNSAVLEGLQFVATDAAKNNLTGKSVMNMSLGGPKSTALNQAIAAISRAGVVPVVAAGNENVDAQNSSPASAPSAITVGAIDASTDTRASFSNFGTALDIFAPGVNVLSVGFQSDTATEVLSGTSMAAPHVAGLAAYLMALDGNLTTPAAVAAKMLAVAKSTGAKAKSVGQGSPTLIANNADGL